MNVHLIALIFKNSRLAELRLFDSSSNEVKDVPYASVVTALQQKKIQIHGVEFDGSRLHGTNGSLERYTKVNNGVVQGKPAFVVINEIGDLGYTICDYNGNVQRLKTADVVKLGRAVTIANGKVVIRNGNEKFISAINGSYDRIEPEELLKQINKKKDNGASTSAKPATAVQNKVSEPVKNDVKPIKPVTPVTPVTKSEDKQQAKIAENTVSKKEVADVKPNIVPVHNTAETVDEKANKVEKPKTWPSDSIFPPHIMGRPLSEVDSMNNVVDESTSMTIEQKLIQGYLVIRNIRVFYYCVLANLKKVETKEIQTMGVSLDTLYYNPEFVLKLKPNELTFVLMHEVMHIAMQHELRKGARLHQLWNVACDFYINQVLAVEFGLKYPGDKVLPKEDTCNVGVAIPEDILLNPKVDIVKDTPEKIYDEILQEYEKMKQLFDSNMSGGQGGDSDSDNNDSSVRGLAGKGGKSDGSDDSTDGNEEGEGESGKAESGKDSGNDGEQSGNPLKETTFRGKKIGDNLDEDMVESEDTRQLSDVQKEDRAKAVLDRAVTLERQIGTQHGNEAGTLERFVKELMAPKINWVQLLRNKMTIANQKTTTFSAPDRRFLGRNKIMPGPKKLDNNTLENVKICIDTSGSIDDEDLGIAFNQIGQLLKQFKAQAEVIYWDAEVQKVADFKNFNELLRIKPKGGGGTDVNVVFEHFETGDYKKGKKKKPSIIIIFTDGYFGAVEKKYKKYKDTIWVIRDNDSFKEPFGIKAKFEDGK